MKNILTFFVCVLTMQLSIEASDDKAIEFTKLPVQSQQLIEMYFPDQSIALIKKEWELFEKSYEVIFTNGSKIEFDKKGSWKKIVCKYVPLPLEIIPEQIKEYILKNFPNVTIVEIEKESKNKYKVELSNEIKLKFDSKFRLFVVTDW